MAVRSITTDTKALKAILFALAIYALLLPFGEVMAQTKVGDMMMKGAQNTLSRTPLLIQTIAYISGFAFAVIGLLKIKAHVDNAERTPLSHGLWYLLAATLLISLPAAMNLLQNSTLLKTPGKSVEAAAAFGLNGAGNGLDKMMIRFVNDIRKPLQFIIWGSGVVLGLFLLTTGFMRMAKGAGQDGPRGSLGPGTLMRILVGAILFSTAATADMFTASLFGNAVVQFKGLAIANIPAASLANAEQAIGAILTFIQIIGFIAFMRGFLMFRALADGNTSVSSSAAFTHVIGGALAINISPTLAAIEQTFCGGSCGFASFG